MAVPVAAVRPPPCPPPAGKPWRAAVDAWPCPDRDRWATLADALEDGGLAPKLAEALAYLVALGGLGRDALPAQGAPPSCPWRDEVRTLPAEWQERWGHVANELEEREGLPWAEAERRALAVVTLEGEAGETIADPARIVELRGRPGRRYVTLSFPAMTG